MSLPYSHTSTLKLRAYGFSFSRDRPKIIAALTVFSSTNTDQASSDDLVYISDAPTLKALRSSHSAADVPLEVEDADGDDVIMD